MNGQHATCRHLKRLHLVLQNKADMLQTFVLAGQHTRSPCGTMTAAKTFPAVGASPSCFAISYCSQPSWPESSCLQQGFDCAEQWGVEDLSKCQPSAFLAQMDRPYHNPIKDHRIFSCRCCSCRQQDSLWPARPKVLLLASGMFSGCGSLSSNCLENAGGPHLEHFSKPRPNPASPPP